MENLKRCTKCGEEKELGKFYKKKCSKDGLGSYCKICDNIRKNEWIKNNPEKAEEAKKRSKEWAENNPEKTKEAKKRWAENNPERNREYYQNNLEKVKEKSKIYRQNNSEKIKEYRKNNPGKIRESLKKWQKNNIEKIREYSRIYRQNNCEKMKEWYQNNREKINEKCRIRYKNNLEKEKARSKKYYQNNREKINEYCRNRKKINIHFRLKSIISSSIYKRLKHRLLDKNRKPTFSFLPYTIDDLIKHLESLFQPWMNWGNYGRKVGYWVIDHIKPDSLFHYTSVEDEEFQKCWALENLQPMEWMENIKKSNKYFENLDN